MKLHPAWKTLPADIRFSLAASNAVAEVRTPAFLVIDALQGVSPARQIEAAFAASVILARAAGLDPHDLVARARRQIPDIEAVESAASAISDYAAGELKR